MVVERNHAVAGLLLVMQGLNKELAGAQMSRFSTKQAARKVHNKGGARDRQHSGKKGGGYSSHRIEQLLTIQLLTRTQSIRLPS